jgi:hypothetical protein
MLRIYHYYSCDFNTYNNLYNLTTYTQFRRINVMNLGQRCIIWLGLARLGNYTLSEASFKERHKVVGRGRMAREEPCDSWWRIFEYKLLTSFRCVKHSTRRSMKYCILTYAICPLLGPSATIFVTFSSSLRRCVFDQQHLPMSLLLPR